MKWGVRWLTGALRSFIAAQTSVIRHELSPLRSSIVGLYDNVTVNAVNLRVNGIDNVCLYAIIVTFLSAFKPAYNMRQPLILPQS